MQKMMNDSTIFFAIISRYFVNHRHLTSNEFNQPIDKSSKISKRIEHLQEIIAFSDKSCIDNLRMSRDAFLRLCHLLENLGGLQSNRNITIHEQVAMCLAILGHHTKNRIKHNYIRSGRTVSKIFHVVLNVVIRLHHVLLARAKPVTEDCSSDRWRWF